MAILFSIELRVSRLSSRFIGCYFCYKLDLLSILFVTHGFWYIHTSQLPISWHCLFNCPRRFQWFVRDAFFNIFTVWILLRIRFQFLTLAQEWMALMKTLLWSGMYCYSFFINSFCLPLRWNSTFVLCFRGKMGASLHRASKAQGIGGKPPYLTVDFNLFSNFVTCFSNICILCIISFLLYMFNEVSLTLSTYFNISDIFCQ